MKVLSNSFLEMREKRARKEKKKKER